MATFRVDSGNNIASHATAQKPKLRVQKTVRHRCRIRRTIVARTSGDPNALAETLRRVAHEMSPEVPMKFTTMEAALSENVAAPRVRTLLFGIFAGLALVLACIGVYGVLAYAVAQRTREIGVRMALGARPLDVTRMVVTRGLRLGLLGLAAGIGLALILGRLLQTLLYGVKPVAPAVYAATALALLLIALLACVIPAQRAARVDPVVALRDE